MKVVVSPEELQKEALAIRKSGKSIGLVPTMGALHKGHLSLVEGAKKENDVVIVSLFVNPTQFGPKEDFSNYPKPFENDKSLLEGAGVDILFAPEASSVYPKNYGTYVSLENEFLNKLCGAKRPGHFRGVSTVLSIFFNLAQPNRAYFGLKDYQQVLVVQQMVKDMRIPVEIVPMPIIRESDGVALSSRNRYLTPEERKEAVVLHKSLERAKSLIEQGEKSVPKIRAAIEETLLTSKYSKIDYIEITDPSLLEPLTFIEKRPILIALAVLFGKARLIDNILI